MKLFLIFVFFQLSHVVSLDLFETHRNLWNEMKRLDSGISQEELEKVDSVPLIDKEREEETEDKTDEMNINDIQKFAIVDISPADESYLGRYLMRAEGKGDPADKK